MTVPPDPHLVDDTAGGAEPETTTDVAAEAATGQPAPEEPQPEA